MPNFPTYTAKFAGVGVTVQQDFFEITPADDKPIVILKCVLSQSSDYGDSAAEGLDIRIVSGNSTSGSGGSSFTPLLHSAGFAAAGAACEINNTTKASTGTERELWAENWNIQMPWIYQPTPEEQFVISQADTRVCVRLGTTPADSLTISGVLVFMEIC